MKLLEKVVLALEALGSLLALDIIRLCHGFGDSSTSKFVDEGMTTKSNHKDVQFPSCKALSGLLYLLKAKSKEFVSRLFHEAFRYRNSGGGKNAHYACASSSYSMRSSLSFIN